MKQRILFLINPISGIGKQKTVEKIIEKELNPDRIKYEIAYTQYRRHAHELSKEAVGKFDAVVAVGGDGTVNEVGSALINTDTALAIIPTGSGNGLARYLDIPIRVNKAMQVINEMTTKKIDSVLINDYVSLNVAGIGFDGHISHCFADLKSRGPLAYLRLINKEFIKYQSETYHITIEDKTYEVPAFLISFANSSQWGNNIQIAPGAKIDDGLIDVCIIKDFPKLSAPAYLYALLDQSLTQRPYDVVKRASEVTIECENELIGHADGEPITLGNKAIIKIQPLSLNVIIPPVDFNKNQIIEDLKEILPPLPLLPKLPIENKLKEDTKIRKPQS